jgi:hypothetical protein
VQILDKADIKPSSRYNKTGEMTAGAADSS